jgi:predicted PurR-regulated permease PerM
MMWAALTACFVVVLVVVVAAVIWAGATIISFQQPILIPVAIAAILTYLLDPLVTRMSRGTLSRTKAIALFFAIAFFALGGLTAWLVPALSVQSANFARQIPSYTERARDYIVDLIYRGPLLAVPLTATLKVLFGRYVWGRRLREQALPIEKILAAEQIEVPTHH